MSVTTPIATKFNILSSDLEFGTVTAILDNLLELSAKIVIYWGGNVQSEWTY